MVTLLLATFALAIIIADPVLGIPVVDGNDDSQLQASANSYLSEARLLDLTHDSDEDFLYSDYAETQDTDGNNDGMQDGMVADVQSVQISTIFKTSACLLSFGVDLAEAGKDVACDNACGQGWEKNREEKPGVPEDPAECVSSIGSLITKGSALAFGDDSF